ncbi:bifunctional copper resistance protein CopD/cytochrome c oxidase assembly protein [Micromonospora sp. NBC_01699]|uniref:cytochrome c oxidase assembly protein n=1 Tax=Micromonospora sp. NBC_01699 TaxID=2975984 RepID=UPI002E35F33B|nr:cytochrome c oxidase assembly protein [Micromonospora sp. NBC_01699]
MAVAGGVMAALLWYGGAARRESLPGLVDPGAVTVWAVPAARLGMQVFAVATIGLLLAAVLLSPRSDAGGLSATGYRRVRAAGWAALAWCLSSVAALCYTLADLLGVPVADAVSINAVINFATTVGLGRALGLSAWLAAVIFLLCRAAITPRGATTALVLAVVAVMPPVFTGHAAAASNHQLAVSGLLLHVVPVAVWAGGLLALALTNRAPTAALPVAVRRFSPLATVCLALVGVSGLLSAYVRLPDLGTLVDTRYGQLVLIKVIALVGLGAAGWWQRRAAMPALNAGDRLRFVTTATVEVLLFAAAIGTAVALSRTPAPVQAAGEESIAQALLGYPMPGPLTADGLLGDWLPEPLSIAAAVIAAGLYLRGVWRLHRRGDTWPLSRTVVFLAGWAVIVVATSGGVARYAPVLFSVHMTQHLLLTMVAPILLALSGPVTLALRALPASKDPHWPGPREWIQAALHSRPARVLTHPVVALALYVGSLYAMYFTGLYEMALRSHATHLIVMIHFVATGYLLFWVVIGVDPAPRRPPHPVRMLLVLVAMVLHAFLGVALMQSRTLVAADWFTALARPWGDTPLDDQRTAGGIAWSFGEIPTLIVLAVLLVQWIRADEREQRRLDRAADRAQAEGHEDDALAAYNTMLTRLAQRDQATADRQPDGAPETPHHADT